ncbi:hypothetical protein OH492_10240 [Vibrio chagasii]|nr:hypothetical protein [Vibrio chagasii]
MPKQNNIKKKADRTRPWKPYPLAWDYDYDDFGNLVLKREHGRLDDPARRSA